MNIQNLIPWSRSAERVPTLYSDGERDPFLALHRDVNRLFDEALRGFGMPFGGGGRAMGAMGGVWPSLEIRDGEKEIRVVAEVPGMDANDVEVLLQDNALTLRGERRSENDDADRGFSERFYGRFERRIPLPDEVEAEQVKADFTNGVLTVTLPKSERAQSHVRRIEIGKSA
jgi:HSP20 family protein